MSEPADHIIALHAFTTDEEGNETYADPAIDDGPFRWTVYRRWDTPGDPQQPFDTEELGDFDTYEAAAAAAHVASERHGSIPVQEY